MANYSIAPQVLEDRARQLRGEYCNAKPFPHIAIDNFFPSHLVEQVLSEFPTPEQVAWKKFDNAHEVKLASSDERTLGPTARGLIWEMNSQVFLKFLESLTGIQNLIADPQLAGGGMHQILPGGKLGVHVDFNRHDSYKLDRRLNLLLYLNKDWKEEYGGHLELWDREVKSCEQKILPVFNRVAIFSTTEYSFHGHPNPLRCPEGRTRKSLALYYYTNGRPEDETSHAHSTVFRTRPGETVKVERPEVGLRDFVPPILVRAVRKLRRR